VAKALALAANMGNAGDILAYDIDENRLKEVRPRARRAGATVIRATAKKAAPNGARVSSTSCWSMRLQRLRQLAAQSGIEMASDAGKTENNSQKSRPIFSTTVRACVTRRATRLCHLFSAASENDDAIAGFLSRNPHFPGRRGAEVWRANMSMESPPGMGQYFRASP